MRAYRDIAMVAAAQASCFLLLTFLEPRFVVIHLYQSLVYIALLVMFFYSEDRWAYMIGILNSVVWLGLIWISPILMESIDTLRKFRTGSGTAILVSLMAFATVLLAMLMIVLCVERWRKEYAGLGKGRSTFLVSLGIVLAYYGIFMRWFWAMIP